MYPSALILRVCAFWGRSDERRGVFGRAEFKHQQCFSRIAYCTFRTSHFTWWLFWSCPWAAFFYVDIFLYHLWNVPNMASTMPSLRTSKDPEQTKCCACRASPWRIKYSPGAQNEVLMCKDSERRHPLLAEEKRGSCRMSLFRCMAMSARSSSGKSCKS